MGQAYLAKIREQDCIGCTKCIDACPTDAILGSDKLMHTVISTECIGCKLCVPPCPVDCIELIAVSKSHPRIPPEYVKQRYHARAERLRKNHTAQPFIHKTSIDERKQYIADAIRRSQTKKSARNNDA